MVRVRVTNDGARSIIQWLPQREASIWSRKKRKREVNGKGKGGKERRKQIPKNKTTAVIVQTKKGSGGQG